MLSPRKKSGTPVRALPWQTGSICLDIAWFPVQVYAARMVAECFTRAATTEAVSKDYFQQVQLLSERINRMSRMEQVCRQGLVSEAYDLASHNVLLHAQNTCSPKPEICWLHNWTLHQPSNAHM